MKRIFSRSTAVAVVLCGFLVLDGAVNAAPVSGVCPPVGADTDCGTVITLANSGSTLSASVTWTGQGPYDATEDTLVGVVNNTSNPVSSLGLTSLNTANGGIFGFDGDGIASTGYDLPGNAKDTTQYGGPNAYYTAISADQTTGVVNFITPIPPGGTSYFALENALNEAHSCAATLNHAVTGPTLANNGTRITATFTPNFGYSLQDAAVICGVTGFDWQETVTRMPLPNPFHQAESGQQLSAPPSFNDPPAGGYTFETSPDNSYPFYYDPSSGELASHETATTLSYADTPANQCLPGGSGQPCGGATAPAGSSMAFTTHLVGVSASRTVVDFGIGFDWTSSFNGTSGGISTTKNDNPADPGSGTGSATVVAVTTTTTYQGKGVNVTSVNGSTSVTTVQGNPLCPCGVYLPAVLSQASSAQSRTTGAVRPAAARPSPARRPNPITGAKGR